MGGYAKPLVRLVRRVLYKIPGVWDFAHPDRTPEQQIREVYGRKAAKEYQARIAKIKARGKE